jgi:hypothetical protein
MGPLEKEMVRIHSLLIAYLSEFSAGDHPIQIPLLETQRERGRASERDAVFLEPFTYLLKSPVKVPLPSPPTGLEGRIILIWILKQSVGTA